MHLVLEECQESKGLAMARERRREADFCSMGTSSECRAARGLSGPAVCSSANSWRMDRDLTARQLKRELLQNRASPSRVEPALLR